jgi:formate dehydrogenase maturation protein FdhE
MEEHEDYTKCPFCGSEDTDSHKFNFHKEEAYMMHTCDDCCESWYRVFKFDRIEGV